MAKKRKGMSAEDKAAYLQRCQMAIQSFKAICGPLEGQSIEDVLIECTSNGIIGDGIWSRTEYLLRTVAPMILRIIQEPEETSEYDESSLKEFRVICRRLGDIRVLHLQQQLQGK